MRKITFFIFVFYVSLYPQVEFNKYFLDKTLRIDFYETGDKNNEIISINRLIEEKYWGGSDVNLIDTFFYGNYFFKVYDLHSNKLIYSRGFSTLFQEWQTTDEADTVVKTFTCSVTFPYPKSKVRIEIDKRDRNGKFVNKFTYTIDPNNYFIIKEQSKKYEAFKVHYSGDHHKKLDIVIVPEGYTKEEMEKFHNDCDRFAEYLFEFSPFSESREKINIWGIEAPSEETGTDIPAENIWKNTLVNSRFYTFDSERYLMTEDYYSVRDVASNAPYDQIFILVNTSKYGGGAIYNFYNVTASDNRLSKLIFVHEFGHGLAGLADEYADTTTYNEFYNLAIEPWEPNITTLVNFDSKWKSLIDENTPVPTPNDSIYANKIGVFEGGGYVSKGVYRPTLNSLMRSFSSSEFNEVCRKAIIKVINFYSE
ncbi:M64 family metallopeptidase [Melioribacter sp. OK-6-Me]|uniref:M64 family metallopeptidase n=1 Tax=unclassified Melioribacter TaxID=2627329 RepID=UPI003EDB1750